MTSEAGSSVDHVIEVLGRECYLDGVLNEILCQNKLHDLSVLSGVVSVLLAGAERALANARTSIKESPQYSTNRKFKSGREADRELDEMCPNEYHDLVLIKSLERGLTSTQNDMRTIVSALKPKF